MRSIFTLASLLFFFFANAQTVSTQFGQIQGQMNGTVHEFKGIPFAKPPVDSLRWRAPQNPESWAGTLNTTAFAPACPQKLFTQLSSPNDTSITVIGSEDCLYLNVWTPQLGASNLPVMVFIHGGGNQQGSAGENAAGTAMYDGKNLAERGNAVVVTIQYRLGPLGFLVHPGLETENTTNKSGNYAVLDQILALKWVRNNISNFGGDTTKTMIFGESAGGVDVGNLLTTPLASGLFSRACIQSASPVINNYTDTKSSGVNYVNNYIASGTEVEKIAYMRSLPADSLVKNQTSPMAGGVAQMNWGAVLDNVVFNQFTVAAFQNGNFNKVPLMIGSNADESSLTVPSVVTPAMVTSLVNSSVPVQFRPQVLAQYPAGTTNAEARNSYVQILTDIQFTANTRRTARCVSMNQTEPVWRYFFTHRHTIPQLAQYGSYHGMELFYVFNNWENTTAGSGVLFKPADDSVQQAMYKYWVNFANTGNPNGSTLPTWQQYDASTDCYLEIKATPDGSQCGLRTVKTDLWDSVQHFTFCRPTPNDTTAINELNEETLNIYPNPVNHFLSVKLPNENFEVTIFDLTEKKIVELKNSSGKAEIDCSRLANGVYLLRSGNITRRIVVAH